MYEGSLCGTGFQALRCSDTLNTVYAQMERSEGEEEEKVSGGRDSQLNSTVGVTKGGVVLEHNPMHACRLSVTHKLNAFET